jgi:hypothetical protein
MKKCHYITDKTVGRVLIPYCYATDYSGDISDCTCPRPKKKSVDEQVSELLARVKQLEERISGLEKSITRNPGT